MKEAVHVPTYELAEEVLRVAKENGLPPNPFTVKSMLNKVNNKDLCFRFYQGFGYSRLGFYQEKGYKIITAEEFLNRYKPKFRPIAMKCTQAQFDVVKDKLVGCRIVFINDFNKDPYLINNRCSEDYVITNVCNYTKDLRNRQVFEEWNEKTFLEYCGISIGIEDSHRDVHVKGCFNTDRYELEQLRKENEELRSINDTLNKENLEHHNELTLLKEKLKAIEDQPKIGDVCLYWQNGSDMYELGMFSEDIKSLYDNCIKATPENIQAKIEELKND